MNIAVLITVSSLAWVFQFRCSRGRSHEAACVQSPRLGSKKLSGTDLG